MNCDKCNKTGEDWSWYHLSCNDEKHAFCSRRCLVEFIAPEMSKVAVVKQWIPNEEEIRRMSEEST
jgi:hypothetical protein